MQHDQLLGRMLRAADHPGAAAANQPPAAQIYVVVHEYCHFLANHSPAFLGEVEKLLPDWKARRELLKK